MLTKELPKQLSDWPKLHDFAAAIRQMMITADGLRGGGLGAKRRGVFF